VDRGFFDKSDTCTVLVVETIHMSIFRHVSGLSTNALPAPPLLPHPCSAPGIDIVPTFTTNNDRMCLVLRTGQLGLLRIEDAERLQVHPYLLPWFVCVWGGGGQRRDTVTTSLEVIIVTLLC